MEITLHRTGAVELRVAAPPSKSYTHRALIAGALASGTTRIKNPLHADDITLTARALEQLGIPIQEEDDGFVIEGCGGSPACPAEPLLDLGNSGTSLRLLTSTALLCETPVVLTGSPGMLERPVGPLVQALNSLGGEIRYVEREGYPPIRVQGRFRGGTATINGSISSQFISSILMAAPYAEEDVELIITESLASRSYLDVTADIMQTFGAKLKRDGYFRFMVGSGVPYAGREYAVEGDYSSASYLFAVAACCGGRVTVTNLNPASVQGDVRFLDALESMGCRVARSADGVTVERDGALSGTTIDMSSSPDTVQTLCMVAAVAESQTTITGIGHLKYKESDRIRVTAEGLRRMGARVSVQNDSISISPGPLRGTTIDPVDDHRTAMSFAVLGLGIGGVTVQYAECVKKSFPGFWEILKGAGLL